MKKKTIFITLVLTLVFIIAFLVAAYFFEWRYPNKIINTEPLYSNKIINTEPLILSGDQKLEIINTKYVQKNDILLSGNAQLIVRDSYFIQEGEGAQAFSLTANDNSKVIFENSTLTTSSWTDWSFYGNSKLIYNKSFTQLGPWHGFWGNSSLLATESAFGGTIYDNSKFIIKDSPSVFIEIYVFENETIDETGLKPGKIDKFVFPNEGEVNIPYSIMIENSEIGNWGIGIGPRGTMTLRNSRNINICMTIGSPYLNEIIYFDNLKKDVIYKNRIIEYAGTKLILEDVSAKGWCLGAHNDNTIYISNSDIDDINHNSGNAKMYYENVVSNVAITTDNNYLELKNSVIKGDVIATGNSTIVLINTKVEGKILEKNNGKVII